jgi:sucrose phosphorylase
MLAVQGIPALYVHSMLVSPGEVDAVAASGHNRAINRGQVTVDQANSRLASGWRADVFREITGLIRLRRSLPAFAPEAAQTIHVLDNRVVAIERRTTSDMVFAVHNVSDQAVTVTVPDGFGLHDLLTDRRVDQELTLGPWQAAWLV